MTKLIITDTMLTEIDSLVNQIKDQLFTKDMYSPITIGTLLTNHILPQAIVDYSLKNHLLVENEKTEIDVPKVGIKIFIMWLTPQQNNIDKSLSGITYSVETT